MTKKPLARFWKALDEIPQATTDRREWLLRLKDDWPTAKPYLTQIGVHAKEIACPSPGGDGCPRKIVSHGDGRYRAVCGNRPAECESLDLTAEEIACLAVNRKKLARAVAKILNASPETDTQQGGAAMIVGSHGVAAGLSIPVAVLIPGPMAEYSLDLLPELDGPAAIVIPTPDSLPPKLKTVLKSREHVVLALSEITAVDDQDRLIGLQPAENLLSPLREKLLSSQVSAASPRIWLLPAGTRWEDLTFEFISDEVVNVRFRGETKHFEPDQFRMKSLKNGRPTLLWTLLLSIVRQHGRLTWKDRSASTRLKKQKQQLSERLRSLFGLDDDPIPWRSTDKAYVARFITSDRTPVRSRSRNSIR
jgi:hypothetical protein